MEHDALPLLFRQKPNVGTFYKVLLLCTNGGTEADQEYE